MLAAFVSAKCFGLSVSLATGAECGWAPSSIWLRGEDIKDQHPVRETDKEDRSQAGQEGCGSPKHDPVDRRARLRF
jgi:hypothetical protein